MAPFIAGKKRVFVPILRAWLGLLDDFLELVPSACMGHVALYRDPTPLATAEYDLKASEELADRLVIVCDPMLAPAIRPPQPASASTSVGRA